VPVMPMLPITLSSGAEATSELFLQWCTTMMAA